MALPRESNASQRFTSDGNHANSHTVFESDPNHTLYLNVHENLNLHENLEILLDPTLDYISRCLMEEGIDENVHGYHERALRDIEKPFYDILGESYTPLEHNQLVSNQSFENPNFIGSVSNDQVCSSSSEGIKQKLNKENLFTIEFHRGVEEGMKFLPNLKEWSIDLPIDQMKKCDNNSLEFKLEQEEEDDLLDRSKGKKNLKDDDLDILERRNCKIPSFSCEDVIRDETTYKILLYHGENYERNEISSLIKNMKLKENSQNQDNNIDLRALLISCAEAVSSNNKNIAGALLKEIRKQAYPTGNGIQRFASILADGLEARLAGAGSVTYRRLVERQVSTFDILKAFHLSLRASPELKVLHHFANRSILNNASRASVVHVIDFGFGRFFGFQWPSLIQALSKREGGPPKLRVTGIDVPQPGFRPAQRVEQMGRMLENYARDFDVPFEYQGIASKWESICMDDLSIKDGEMLIINSINLLNPIKDEPLLGMNSPRNKVLKLILEAKPQVFIQGISNFSFTPFFLTRFKKVFSHFSKFFDILDTLVPRDNMQRQLIERTIFAPPLINLIACEGSDLVVRTENYKEWHKRNLQIGFEQIPLDSSVLKECNRIVRNGYNKSFFVEEDCSWILLGWNGNIHFAISLWKPQVQIWN